VQTFSWRSSPCRDGAQAGRRLVASSLLLLLPSSALFGQALQIAPVKAVRGGRATLQVAIVSPRGRQPLALQWEMVFPANQLRPLDGGSTLTALARAAGKTATCAPKTPGDETSGFRCILIGGRQPIPNGIILHLQFRVLPDAPKGPASVQLDHGIWVLQDMAQAPFGPAEGVVRIR